MLRNVGGKSVEEAWKSKGRLCGCVKGLLPCHLSRTRERIKICCVSQQISITCWEVQNILLDTMIVSATENDRRTHSLDEKKAVV